MNAVIHIHYTLIKRNSCILLQCSTYQHMVHEVHNPSQTSCFSTKKRKKKYSQVSSIYQWIFYRLWWMLLVMLGLVVLDNVYLLLFHNVNVIQYMRQHLFLHVHRIYHNNWFDPCPVWVFKRNNKKHQPKRKKKKTIKKQFLASK